MAAAARLRWNTRRNIFPLAFLPGDIVLLLCEFLSAQDKSSLSQVNRYFRQILLSPHAWKGGTVIFKRNRRVVDRHLNGLLEVLAARGIISIELTTLDLELIASLFKFLPNLERLSFPESTCESVKVLQECAKSAGSLREIHLGKLCLDGQGSRALASRLSCLLEGLAHLQEVSFGLFVQESSDRRKWPIEGKLKSALCAHGNLRSLAINGCNLMDSSWIQGILERNPHIHTLKLRHVRHITCDRPSSVEKDIKSLQAPRVSPNLKTLDLTGTASSIWSFFWFPRHLGIFYTITSLNLTECFCNSTLTIISQFSNLEELNLTRSSVTTPMLANLSLTKLRWLELCTCRGVSDLSVFARSKKLQYLGLAHCQHVPALHLKTIVSKFPELRSLDLSCCDVDNDILNEWYLKSCVEGLLKLRKLNLTGCRAVTQATIDLLRLKTRNSLFVQR